MSDSHAIRLSRRTLVSLAAASALGISGAASAQLDIEITGVGGNLFPIAVPGFSGTSHAPGKVADVIAADLVRSGRFRRGGSTDEIPYTQIVNPDAAPFRDAGCNAAVLGVIAQKGPNLWTLSCRLLDTVNGTVMDAFEITSSAADLRMSAHKLADRIYERLTGIPGCFASRITYVLKRGSVYELVIADSDGENARVALRSREPVISPAWSPLGDKVAYVSFESRKPVVYVHELRSGQRKAVAAFRGNNSAPAFSPNGAKLAVALSKDGGTQIYLTGASGGTPSRFTSGYGINTEPVFSPDGSMIYFTSDRGGLPQIYRQPVSGGSASRVTFSASYAVSPALSPDGKKLAYVSRSSRGFQVCVQDLATGSSTPVTKTAGDESPSFSPNGEFILYAVNSGGSGTLALANCDGTLSTRISSRGGSIREPSWGPRVK